jgi:hypothetical protein
MRHLTLLAVLLTLCFDFAVLDPPLLIAGTRAVQWEDEEESVPSRRQRVGAEQCSTPRPEPAPRTGDDDEVRAAALKRVGGLRPSRPSAPPIRQALAVALAPPPTEDH